MFGSKWTQAMSQALCWPHTEDQAWTQVTTEQATGFGAAHLILWSTLGNFSNKVLNKISVLRAR